MTEDVEREVPVSLEEVTRIRDDDEAVTYHFDHAPSVTLVAEKNRRKWKTKQRPEDAGDVYFVGKDFGNRIRYSHVGVDLDDDVTAIGEGHV